MYKIHLNKFYFRSKLFRVNNKRYQALDVKNVLVPFNHLTLFFPVYLKEKQEKVNILQFIFNLVSLIFIDTFTTFFFFFFFTKKEKIGYNLRRKYLDRRKEGMFTKYFPDESVEESL